MKKIFLTAALTATLIMGAACSGNGESASSSASIDEPSASQGVLSIGSGSGDASYQEYADLPGSVVLTDYESSISVEYAAPADPLGGGRDKKVHDPSGDIWFVYDYDNLNGAVASDATDVFTLCRERILTTDASHFNFVSAAKEVEVTTSDTADINGRSTYFITGTFTCTKNGEAVAVPFAMCAHITGEMLSWCIVMDDTVDQSTPVSALEERADKVAHTYRDHEG